MSEKMTREQERELLELQAMLTRLKIQAAQAKKYKQTQPSQTTNAFAESSSMLHLNQLAQSAGNLVNNRHLLKLAMLPVRWKHRLLLGGALLAWEYYRATQSAQPRQRQSAWHDDVIEVEPDFKRISDK